VESFWTNSKWKHPTERALKFGNSQFQSRYGTGVGTRVIWTGAMATVWVDSLTQAVPHKRMGPFLRSYLPGDVDLPPAGHLLKKFGLPAAMEVEPSCFELHCSGTIAALVLLDGTTVYDVFTVQSGASPAQTIIDSFRLVQNHRTETTG
jgi:hypothetical protein